MEGNPLLFTAVRRSEVACHVRTTKRFIRFEIEISIWLQRPPEGITFKSLSTDDVRIANGVWPTRRPGSQHLLQTMANLSVNVGAYDTNGKMIAWALRYSVDSLPPLEINRTVKILQLAYREYRRTTSWRATQRTRIGRSHSQSYFVPNCGDGARCMRQCQGNEQNAAVSFRKIGIHQWFVFLLGWNLSHKLTWNYLGCWLIDHKFVPVYWIQTCIFVFLGGKWFTLESS